MSNLILLTFALAVLQIGDWYSTRKILGEGGKELNPIASLGMSMFGVNGFLAAKSAVVTALGYQVGTFDLRLLVALVVIYVGVLIWNWRSL